MKPKVVFAGNRFAVCEEVLNGKFEVVKILVIKNSYLEKELISRNIRFIPIESKTHLIQFIESIDFDLFISNGLPHKLPISELTQGNSKRFINIHPSYLPDLRGADPVPGAILFRRDSGATCHEMNDEIDQGDIIARVKIPYSPFWDVLGLYQLSFVAEREVFRQAVQSNFKSRIVQENSEDLIYYTFKDKDLQINLDDGAEITVARVKAFCNRSKGAILKLEGAELKIFDAEILDTQISQEILKLYDASNFEVISAIEDQMIISLHGVLVKFKKIVGELSEIKKGFILK